VRRNIEFENEIEDATTRPDATNEPPEPARTTKVTETTLPVVEADAVTVWQTENRRDATAV
jgi:hypothetical protein